MKNTLARPLAWIDSCSGRHPLFIASLVTVLCVLAADSHIGWGFLVAAVCALAGLAAVGWRTAMAWLCCGIVAVAVFSLRDATRVPMESLAAAYRGKPAVGRVLEDARGSQWRWAAPVKLQGHGPPGVKIWWEGSGEIPVAGARVSARGEFTPLPEPRNPGEFDRAAWFRSQGITAAFHAMRGDTRVVTSVTARAGASLKRDFRQRVTTGLPDDSRAAHLIRAVVIGERPPDEPELIDAFRRSGSLHVFSVSGLHVSMVGGIGWLVLAGLGVPRRMALPCLIPMIFAYAWITGNSAPAVRSAWMAAVFLGAFGLRRQPDLLNSLGAVLLVAMLWNGRLLFQPGVQLSYGVVAAIAIGLSWTTRVFAWMARPEMFLPHQMMNPIQHAWLKLRRWLAATIAVSVAACTGSTPLTVLHFGLITPVSVLASVVLLPMVFILLSVALLASALFTISPPAAQLLNRLNGHVADACAIAAQGFASIPGSHYAIHRDKRPRLIVYDLQYGDGAACFTDGAGSAVMIDCGSRSSFRYLLAPSLRQLGINPDRVVLSHPDGGHLGGGAQVWQHMPVRQAWLPVGQSRSPAFRDWLTKAPQNGIRIIHGKTADQLPLPDDATLEVLHVPAPETRHALADERVAVFRLHWRGWKILLTSDAGMGTELQLLDAGANLAADVIIAGRNRTDVTLCDRFIEAVQPRAIIASNTSYPENEQLPQTSVEWWKSRGIHVIDQNLSGGLTLTVDDTGALVIEGFLADKPLRLAAR
jgi:ComEC/Rec2-related protein